MKIQRFLQPKSSSRRNVILGLILAVVLFVILRFTDTKLSKLQVKDLLYSPQVAKSQQNVLTPSSSYILPSISTSAQGESTANWNTHTNANLGFSIKYPPSWLVYTQPTSGLGYSFQSPDLQTGYGGAVQVGAYLSLTLPFYEQGSQGSRSSNYSLEEWILVHSETNGDVKTLSQPMDVVQIAGFQAVQLDREIFLFGKTRTTALSTNKGVFVFDCFSTDDNHESAISICDQMIHTFQLVP